LNVNVKSARKSIKSYNYKKGKYEILKTLVENIDWEEKFKNNSVNDVWDFIKMLLINFKERHIPWVITNKSKDAPWMNKNIRKQIKKRNNLFKRYKKGASLI